MAGKIRGWIRNKTSGIWEFLVNDGTERVVFDEHANIYPQGKQTYIANKAGTAANGDIVIDAPFEPSGMIVQGLSATGAPVAFDTATYATGKITITVTTGAATDNWSVIIWQ